jgi:acyl-CoA dehydrogenase
MEQFVRDARIAMIYEGANGVQGLDLVGRKLPKDGGRAVMAYFKEVEGFVKENDGNETLATFVKPLKAGLDDLQKATMWFMKNALAKPDNAGAGATDYMHLFGLVAIGHMWGLIAATANTLIDAGDERADRLKEVLLIGNAYVERAMPETALRLARIGAGSDALMAVPEAGF